MRSDGSPHRQQRQGKITDANDYTMQRRLVDDRSDQHGGAIFLAVYGHAPKPVRPAVGEVTFYSP